MAVRDGNLVADNGAGALEFAREVLFALDAYTAEHINRYYQLYKNGCIDAMKNR